MNSMNSLLVLMLASYIIPIAYVYYKYSSTNASDPSSSTPRSISSIITSQYPLFTINDNIMLGLAASVFQTRHFIAACMFVMAIFTLLYEHQRSEMYLNSARWSLSAIIVLLLGIFGVIYVPETNPVHYIFAAAAFFAIIGFMTWHTWWHNLRLSDPISDNLRLSDTISDNLRLSDPISDNLRLSDTISDNLRLLLYAQILFMVLTVIGILQDAPIFAVEALFLMNFAVFYLYLHFNCFSTFFTVKN